MASGFILTAQIQLRGPNNVGSIASSIQRQLGNINATVNIRMPKNVNSQLSSLTKQVTSLNTALNNLNKSSGLSNITKSLNTVTKSTQQANTAAFQFGEAVGQAARKFAAFSIAAGAMVSVISAFKNGVSAAISFQHEMVRLQQIGGDFDGILSSISSEITRLSTSLGTSSSDLIKVANTLRQAGFSASETATSLKALAEASIAPTFSDAQHAVEGAIAAMQQFNLEAKDLYGVMSTINSVSANFAVESDDLIHALRRSGGAFKAAGGQLNELLALFTSVRQTTRESAETIATGFNTIFARLQRPEAVEQLRLMGINLRYTANEARAFGKTENEFVGPYEAIRRINKALASIPPASQEYAQVVELIGGFRQVSKVVPLIQQFSVAEQALSVALSGQNSLATSTIIAQKSLQNQLNQVKEEFLSLFRVLSGNKFLNDVVGLMLSGAKAAASLAKNLEPLVPLVTILAIGKIGRTIGTIGSPGFLAGFSKGARTQSKFATGGVVPGSGNGDTVPALLTPGEYVVRKAAAQKIGYHRLAHMNKYASGGPARYRLTDSSNALYTEDEINLFLDPNTKKIPSEFNRGDRKIADQTWKSLKTDIGADFERDRSKGGKNQLFLPFGNDLVGMIGQGSIKDSGTKKVTVKADAVKGINNNAKDILENLAKNKGDIHLKYDSYVLSQDDVDKFKEDLLAPVSNAIRTTLKTKFGDIGDVPLKESEIGTISGILLEKYIAGVSQKQFNQSDDIFDFPGGLGENSSLRYMLKPSNMPHGGNFFLDAKNRVASSSAAPSLIKKYLNVKGNELDVTKMATGGTVGVGTDTVPALLTPGEFVINKQSAQKIGYPNLNRINRYASGGPVFPNSMYPNPVSPFPKSMFTPPKDTAELKVLKDILAAIKAGGIGGGKSGGSMPPLSSNGTPNLSNVSATATPAGKWDFLKKRAGLAGVVAAQYIPQISEGVLGSATNPGLLGKTGAKIGSAASQSVSYAAMGSSFGPFGTVIGGIYGLAKGLNDFDQELRNSKFAVKMEEFSGAVDRATADLSPLSNLNISQLKSGFDAIIDNAKYASDRNMFLAEKVNTGDLNKVADKLARTAGITEADSADQRFKKFNAAGGGLGEDIITLMRQLPEQQGKSLEQIFKPFEDVAIKIAGDATRAKELEKLGSAILAQTKQLDNFGAATRGATDNLLLMNEQISALDFSVTPLRRFSSASKRFGAAGEDPSSAVEFITSPLSAGGEEIKTQIQSISNAFSILPEVLNETFSQLNTDGYLKEFDSIMKRNATSMGMSIDQAVINSLKTSLGGVEDLQEKVSKDVASVVEDLRKSAFPNLAKVIEDSSKDLEDALNTYTSNLAKAQELEGKILESRTKSSDLSFDRATTQRSIVARRSGLSSQATMPVGLQLEKLNSRQATLLGNTPNNVSSISDALKGTISKIDELNNQRANTNTYQGQKSITKDLNSLGSAANKLKQALENLADPTEKNAILQERINEINAEEQQRLSLAERYLVGGPQQRAQMDFTANATAAVADGFNIENFAPDIREAIFQLTKDLDNIKTPMLNGLTGKDFRQQLLERTYGGKALSAGQNKERNSLENQQITNFNIAMAAQKELTSALETQQSTFLSRLEANQNAFLQDFNRILASAELRDRQAQVTQKTKDVTGAFESLKAGKTIQDFGINNFQTARNLSTDQRFTGNKDSLSSMVEINDTMKKFNASLGNLKFDDKMLKGVKDSRVKGWLGDSVDEIALQKLVLSSISSIPGNQQIPAEVINTVAGDLEAVVEQLKINDPKVVQNFLKDRIGTLLQNTISSNQKNINTSSTELAAQYNIGPNDGSAILNIVKNLQKFQDNVAKIGNSDNFATLEQAYINQKDSLDQFGKAVTEAKARLDAIGTNPPATGFAVGGSVFKPRGTDVVPAMLTPGEFVVNAKATRKNKDLLYAINSGTTSYLAGGGQLGTPRRRNTVGENLWNLFTGKHFGDILYSGSGLSKLKDLGDEQALYSEVQQANNIAQNTTQGYKQMGLDIEATRSSIDDLRFSNKNRTDQILQQATGAIQSGNQFNTDRLPYIQATSDSARDAIKQYELGNEKTSMISDLQQQRRSLSPNVPTIQAIQPQPQATQNIPSVAPTPAGPDLSLLSDNIRNNPRIPLATKLKMQASEASRNATYTQNNQLARKSIANFNNRPTNQSIAQQMIANYDNKNQSLESIQKKVDIRARIDAYDQKIAKRSAGYKSSMKPGTSGVNRIPTGYTLPKRYRKNTYQGLADTTDMNPENMGQIAENLKNRRGSQGQGSNFMQRMQMSMYRRNMRMNSQLSNYNAWTARGYSNGGTVDTIPAMLSPGEFVVNSKATKANLPLLHSINKGPIYRADGGPVGAVTGNANAGTGDLNNSISAFTNAVTSLAGVSGSMQNIAGQLTVFSQNIQTLTAPLNAFNVASNNLSVGLAMFNNMASQLAQAMNNLSNLPKSITIEGTSQVNVTLTGAETLSSITEAQKNEIINSVMTQLRSELKGGSILGG